MTAFTPDAEDVQYLVSHNIPHLFNDLVADVARDMPGQVLPYLLQWLRSRREQDPESGIEKVTTTPIDGQKTGTSGLRKKTEVFQQPNFLENWLQSLFNALLQSDPRFADCTLVVGGDGRFGNKEALQTFIQMAFANGVGKVIVGQDGLLATPAVSSVIRTRAAFGGVIMTASHNPGGPSEDWGIKYNKGGGEPAPESLTDLIYEETKKITHYFTKKIPEVNLSEIGLQNLPGGHVVEVISSSKLYLDTLDSIFDFGRLKPFVRRMEFTFLLDGMNGVGGVAATRFVEQMALGDKAERVLQNNIPKEDFGGLHPDPNLKYASHLVDRMFGKGDQGRPPVFGAAFDGDADRNMILGREFFVTPSDSVAIIAHYAQECIPYFQKTPIKGLARSMPTAMSLDRVGAKLGVTVYEVPTGWKYFGNLMDAEKVSICGEESFGTGADHIREKDGLWAILAWISILQYVNPPTAVTFKGVKDITQEFWKLYGRSLYCRYDYDGIQAPAGGGANPADTAFAQITALAVGGTLKGKEYTAASGEKFAVSRSDVFEYTDPLDGSVAKDQGVRFFFAEGTRLVFRVSGTGSSGVTIRMYMEMYVAPGAVDVFVDSKDACKPMADVAMQMTNLETVIGRSGPTVIT